MSDPRQKDFDERHTKLPTVQALTKREYFAVMAMKGLLSGSDGEYKGPGNTREPKYIALMAIECADELIKSLQS